MNICKQYVAMYIGTFVSSYTYKTFGAKKQHKSSEIGACSLHSPLLSFKLVAPTNSELDFRIHHSRMKRTLMREQLIYSSFLEFSCAKDPFSFLRPLFSHFSTFHHFFSKVALQFK
jgi:hypothetical protein